MRVIGRVARVMLDYLKSYATEGGYRPSGESGKILETAFHDEAFLVWVNAYAEYMPGFREKLRSILMDLSSPRKDDIESIFQKGLFSTISAENLAMLETRLSDALAIPFGQSVDLALKHLPKRTKINVDVYITVDPFNTGMMRPGKVFLSILLAEITPQSVTELVHEFHHAGAFYWLDKNPQLRALESSHEHAQMLAEVFTYCVTEGLANWYASSAIRTVEGDEEHNKVIRRLEKEKPQLMKDLEQLLNWICGQRQPVEEVKTAFKSLSIDTSGSGVPAGHFLSGSLVGAMHESNTIPKEKIIALVKHPLDFFDLYNKAVPQKDRLSATLLKLVKNRIEEWSKVG